MLTVRKPRGKGDFAEKLSFYFLSKLREGDFSTIMPPLVGWLKLNR